MTWQNSGPIAYKIRTGVVTKIHGFRSYFWLRPTSRADRRPLRQPRRRGVGFMQSIGNGKCVGHRVLQSRKGRGKKGRKETVS
jgi:hypothetical protein